MEIGAVAGKFAEAFLVAAAPVLATMLITWLVAQIKLAWQELKEKNGELAYWLEQAATMAVNAAEQAKVAGLLTEKKKYAIEVAEKFLKEKGIDIDIDLIDAAVEAAVREMHLLDEARAKS